jgi:flagellar biosynthesis protein FlhB
VAEDRDDQQRTEEPTQRRLDEAHRKGDVVKSAELASFVLLAGGVTAVSLFASASVQRFAGEFRFFLESPGDLVLDSGTAAALLQHATFGLFHVLAPATGLMLLAAFAGHLLQHRPVFSAARLKPDLAKLSPLKGLKRLFGLDGLLNFVKGLAKILLVGGACVWVAWSDRARVATALDLPLSGVAGLALALIFKALLAGLIVFAVIAAADYLYQRQRFMARHRMTRQELRDEIKQSEGDPQVKARIRQIRVERSRKRMIAAIPEATVVITNPTHYAVALKYESGKMSAPVCVAKGVDHLALTIRKVAEENDVPLVENPPLARALYAAVEVDDEIPAEHYKAVAQVIGYVMRLAQKTRYWRS